MKITVGHVLIVGAVVGFFGLKPLSKLEPSRYISKLEKFNLPIDSLKKYLPFQKDLTVTPSPLSRVVVEPPPTPVKTEPVRAEAEPVVEKETAPEPVVAKAAPANNVRAPRKRTRRRGRRAPAATTQAQAAPAAKKEVKKVASAKKAAPPADKLLGTYVALTLKTGREVKGIYQEKTATHYVIELPGMGPFEYPVENVQGIKAAE